MPIVIRNRDLSTGVTCSLLSNFCIIPICHSHAFFIGMCMSDTGEAD